MRRLAFISAALAALALTAVAGAAHLAAGDGSLVVTRGQAPADTPVVQLDKFSGSIIGRVAGFGKIIIDAGPNCAADPQVVGAGRPGPNGKSDTAQQWAGQDFTFRAIGAPGCAYAVVVYSANDSGTGRVFLVASGHGTARIAGTPDKTIGDGRFSLNDADFKSLPGVQSVKLTIGDAP